MQIPDKLRLPTATDEHERLVQVALQSYARTLADLLNGGIRPSDNWDAEFKTIADTGLADSENTVAHGLKRVPSGFIVTKNNKAGVIYLGSTAWTATAIYVKSSVANCAVTILVF